MRTQKEDFEEMEMPWCSDENYYLIINDDPGFITIQNEKALLAQLAQSVCYDDSGWHLCKSDWNSVDPYTTVEENIKDLKKIMEWLNHDAWCGNREPSPFFICDEAAYNHIRRITNND
ncbi:MAG: hypothetical protein CMI56_00745 [Parcubacteria group bacterium]|nr:hypothetical protein [Parcubacteria group bacterium]|tara:strand:- start:419 stop:772 length:354 start_codon:yes stop_codon:yes gene_type:complete